MSTRDQRARGNRATLDTTAAPRVRPSWGATADAVGHCVVVFAFVPALAALPSWLVFEATNPLNAQDPVVLAFLPVRGLIKLINTFFVGMEEGVLAGVLAGLLVSAWFAWRGAASTSGGRVLLGAGCGALAAAVMVVALLAWQALHASALTVPAAAAAFEIASGMVCGALAVPRAVTLLAASDGVSPSN